MSSAASGTSSPDPGPNREDRRGHLGCLKATIVRMAAALTATAINTSPRYHPEGCGGMQHLPRGTAAALWGTYMTGKANGVLPDDVSRNGQSESWLIFCDLPTGQEVQPWLVAATAAVNTLVAPADDGPSATCTTAVGASLFDKTGLVAMRPVDLGAPLPALVPPEPHDILFYVFALNDATVADFLRSLSAISSSVTFHIERGYQRKDGRETFGQRDGLRNIPTADREAVAFIGCDQPDEPVWAHGGSYLAYVKIQQNVGTWNALTEDAQATVVGRRADGSRVDLPVGTDPRTEPPLTSAPAAPPALNAHIRKAAPGDAANDPVRIFRRGTPYIEATVGGAISEGLQFVSYQTSMDTFNTMLGRWMLNPSFPQVGSGVDALFNSAAALTTFIKGGTYFAVPHDDRFLGAGMFDPVAVDTAQVHIKLTVTDNVGTPDPLASLASATFQVTDGTGTPVGASFTTDAAGHAVSSPLPINTALIVTEVAAPTGSSVAVPQALELAGCRDLVQKWVNTRTANPGQYGG